MQYTKEMYYKCSTCLAEGYIIWNMDKKLHTARTCCPRCNEKFEEIYYEDNEEY